jgi:hypothetical protein
MIVKVVRLHGLQSSRCRVHTGGCRVGEQIVRQSIEWVLPESAIATDVANHAVNGCFASRNRLASCLEYDIVDHF